MKMGCRTILAQLAGISLVCVAISMYSFYYSSEAPRQEPALNDTGPWPSDSNDNLFWFVQVSDIHISRYWDPQRAPDFEHFCRHTLEVINPDVVLVTGDLTDAKSKNKFDSQQYEDEWLTYQSIIKKTEVTRRFVWLDIRGNHDAFDVLRVRDPNSNLYLKYSGDKGKLSSKVFHLQKPYGKYSFIPVDATMIPGPRRPYNFVGYLPEERMAKLQSFQKEVSKSNLTIWYSHYPTVSIMSHTPGVQSLVGKTGSVYLAGHLHTLGGLSRSLYAMNPRGFLELELRDWLWERAFRIIAVDHDLISFTDMKFNQWPGIILTNPVPANYLLPKFEPIDRISKSSHIRFLIFDPWKIESVEILIDGFRTSHKPRQVTKSNLWVCRWDPSEYNQGMHEIEIIVKDAKGNKESLSQQFSVDSSWTVDFGWLSPFILLTDFNTAVSCILLFSTTRRLNCKMLIQLFYVFHLITFGCVMTITVLRMCNINSSFLIVTRLKSLLRDNTSYYGLLIFPINLSLGPWFAGEVIRGRLGICFSYGVLVDGVLQPDGITLYRDGIRTVLMIYLPCLYVLAKLSDARDVKSKNTSQERLQRPRGGLLLSYVFFLLINFYAIWSLYQSYGLVATILSPSRLWWTSFIIFLTLRASLKKIH